MTDDVSTAPDHRQSVEDLEALNDIAEALNSAVDVRNALETTLAKLVALMGVQTGWIFLRDEAAQDKWDGPGFVLAAHTNLPPALHRENADAWNRGCDCQTLCLKGRLDAAYNEVLCSRLRSVHGDRAELEVHASTPLKAGDQVLGILNVAAPSWTAFSARSLSLLENVGRQLGVALERAQLYEMLQERRVQEQALLLSFTNQLLSRRDLGELMRFLVEEVRTFLKVDACALVLPDEGEPDSLRFRAASGWRRDPAAEGRRFPADKRSGSGLAMATQQPLIMDKIELNEVAPWMADWLPEEGFQAAGIVPLVANGRSIGALVVDSRQPRRLEEGEVRLLQLMANQAALALESARLHAEEIRRQRLDEELAVARQIQLSMLPRESPTAPGWEFVAVYEAARHVGGDFYDFFELPRDDGRRRLGLVIADVADKGIPAALFMALSRTIIRIVAGGDRSPAAALERANQLMVRDSQADLFLTAFYAILDLERSRVVYCNSGHNPPLWLKAATGEVVELKRGGIAMGVMPDVLLDNEELRLEAGDALILYTDGVTETMSAGMEEFGADRMRAVTAQHAASPARDLAQAIVRAANAHRGDASPWDDFTLVVVRRTPSMDDI